MKRLYQIIFILFVSIGFSQTHNDTIKNNELRLAALPYYSFGKGLGVTSADSLFQLNIRFRMQNRVTYISEENEDNRYEAQIRRLRLRFDGYVWNPKFIYVIQLSFAPGDVGVIQDGENVNIIRDAAFYYRPNKHWNLIFGQTKLPGNRQRVNSSGALQLTDRTINNARFTIDRDFGFQAYYLNENKDAFSYNVKTAISTGEGRNWTKTSDDGVALTGKIEILPFGSFSNNGVYFEGDLAREPKPKVMLSAAFEQNNNAVRTNGQLGSLLYEPKTLRSFFLDALFKYKGFAFMSAYMQRNADELLSYNPDDITEYNYVYGGYGMDYQMSYLFSNDFEIIGRFSNQFVDEEIKPFTPDLKQYSFGVTKYIREHAFKLQAEINFDEKKYFSGTVTNNWYVRFQLEIGI